MVILRNKKPLTRRRTLFVRSYVNIVKVVQWGGRVLGGRQIQNSHKTYMWLQRYCPCFSLGLSMFILRRSSWVFISPIKQSRIRPIPEGLSWQWIPQCILWRRRKNYCALHNISQHIFKFRWYWDFSSFLTSKKGISMRSKKHLP